jgi:hypothetical protein
MASFSGHFSTSGATPDIAFSFIGFDVIGQPSTLL